MLPQRNLAQAIWTVVIVTHNMQQAVHFPDAADCLHQVSLAAIVDPPAP